MAAANDPTDAKEAPPAAPVLDGHFQDRVLEAVEAADAPALQRLLAPLHPADFADIVESLSPDDLRRLIATVGDDLPPQMLLELPEQKREQVLDLLPAHYLGHAMGELETDDAAMIA